MQRVRLTKGDQTHIHMMDHWRISRGQIKGEHASRLEDGQAWDLPEAIGHNLTPSTQMMITRTSSQDPGLERSSDIVVATSSLEVGLDDDTVGPFSSTRRRETPHSSSNVVAGQDEPAMRPWTAVVLSDYGRDRLAF